MRVSTQTFPSNLVDQLNGLANSQVKLRNQAVTGQRLTLPADDPSSMRRVLDLQAEADRLAQYRRNIERLQEIATASFAAIKGIKTISDRAGEIAIRADGLAGSAGLNDLAIEIDQLLLQAVQAANARHRGDTLFAGTRSGEPAFTPTTDVDGRVIAVTYNGNLDPLEISVDDTVTFSAHTLGANTSGGGARGLISDSRVGADFFQHLIDLRDHLKAGDLNAVALDREALAADEENLLFHLGSQGAIQQRLETTLSMTKGRSESIATLVSNEADADFAQTIVRLNEVQTAYQAALQTGATLLSQSLLDYLR